MDRPLQEKAYENLETTIEDAIKEGKLLDFIMKCKTSFALEHLRVFVIKILGMVGTQKVHF